MDRQDVPLVPRGIAVYIRSQAMVDIEDRRRDQGLPGVQKDSIERLWASSRSRKCKAIRTRDPPAACTPYVI